MEKLKLPIARPIISDDEQKAVLEVLSSGILTQGENVKRFERKFADYLGVKHAISTNSGTSSLHVAVLALGLKNGDEVITTPFSFAASSNCILYVGAKPVFVDIDPKTYNIDVDKIEDKITNKTRAILPVHLYGQAANMEKIMDVAQKHNLKIIEDACQSHGSEYNGKKTGTIGDVSAFSFYPTKNMTTGEGGMVATNDDKLAEKASNFRNIGQQERYVHVSLGFNYRMQESSAAIGLLQLKKLNDNNVKRIENAKFFTEQLSGINGITTPYVDSKAKHVFHQYTIRINSDKITRDKLAAELEKDGIGTRVYYPTSIHKQPLFKQLGHVEQLPESDLATKEVLSIPVYPSLTRKDLEFIVEKIKSKFV